MASNVDKDTLLSRIKQTVLRLAPGADVILYGSRARGDAQADSDWDILVLTPDEPSQELDDTITDALYDLELETGTVIVPFLYSMRDWNSPRRGVTPLHKNVTAEGIRL